MSEEVRDCAHDHNLSPAKYLAITQLQEVDPSASYDRCAEHSISEIKELTKEHWRHHEEGDGGNGSGKKPEAGKIPEPGEEHGARNENKTGKKPPVIRRMVMKTGKSIMTIKRKRNITNSFSAALSKIMDIWEENNPGSDAGISAAGLDFG